MGAIRESVSTLSAIRFSKDTEIEQSVSTLSALRFSKDTAIEQSVSTLSALRFSKDTEIEQTLSVATAAQTLFNTTISTALADKFEKKQVFTLDNSDSLFYAKDGLVPTTAGQLYIDENGFLRVAMPGINGMSTLNSLFDTRIENAKVAGSYLDADMGFKDPTSDSLSSLYEYYSWVVATLASPYAAGSATPASGNTYTFESTDYTNNGNAMTVSSSATQSDVQNVILGSDAGASAFYYVEFNDGPIAVLYTAGDTSTSLEVINLGYAIDNTSFGSPAAFNDASFDSASSQDFSIYDGAATNTYTLASGANLGIDSSVTNPNIEDALITALANDHGVDTLSGDSAAVDGYFMIGSDIFVAGYYVLADDGSKYYKVYKVYA